MRQLILVLAFVLMTLLASVLGVITATGGMFSGTMELDHMMSSPTWLWITMLLAFVAAYWLAWLTLARR